jgi:Flp pilus assembly protein TadD
MPIALRLRTVLRNPWAAVLLVALALITWGLTLRPHLSPASQHVDAGVEYARRGHGSEAEREWREAARLAANDLRPWDYLAEYYAARQDWPAATEALRHLARLRQDTPRIDARLALSSLRSGDERAAYGYAEASLKREPDDADTLALFASLLTKTGEDQRRLEILRRLVKLRPDDPAGLSELAEALVGKALYSEAKPLVERVLQRDPDDLEARSLRGMIAFNLDPSPQGSARAEADFLRAVSSPRFAPLAHYYLGRIYVRLGEPARAVPHLQDAARALPNKREVFFALAEACDQTGATAEAERARGRFQTLRRDESRIDSLTSQVAADPTNFDRQLELGLLLQQYGEYRRAEARLLKAQALRPNDARVRAALESPGAGSDAAATAPAGEGR